MRSRVWLILLVLLAAVVALPAASTAQTGSRKVIRVVMTSFKFEPSIITVNQGDRVVLQLVNQDANQRLHNISAKFLAAMPFVARGDIARQGDEADGNKFVAVDAGKTAEVEFTATQRGTFTFVCSAFDGRHAANGMTGALNVLLPSP